VAKTGEIRPFLAFNRLFSGKKRPKTYQKMTAGSLRQRAAIPKPASSIDWKSSRIDVLRQQSSAESRATLTALPE
jgi:hypothetical protein